MVREKIYHEAGAHTPQAMSLDELLRLIRGAGRFPRSATRSTTSSARSTTRRPQRRGGRMTMRVGRIPYINCYPVYGAIDRGIVPLDGELVNGVPTRAQRADGRAATLDVSVVSAVEYARDAEALPAAARSRDLAATARCAA